MAASSELVHEIHASVSTVWLVLSAFGNPQLYKQFVKSCQIIQGDPKVIGCVCRVQLITRIPATYSIERLEMLDQESHTFAFSVVGGDHRLPTYRSVTTLHSNGNGGTVVVESYVADVPAGNTEEETRDFIDTIIRCNLRSLCKIAENLEQNAVGIEPSPAGFSS